MFSSSETQELRALYQFGQQDSTTTHRSTDQEPTAATNEHNDVSRNNAEEETFSPREEQNSGMPTSPAAFGTEGDTYVPTGNGITGSYAATSFDAAGEKQHHKSGSKSSVFKKIMGTDKKSTKGMSDDEKKALQLQERWRNAMAEEQRLNDLEYRISQEENLTNIIGQAPNFPPKLLCIRPLVFHKISAISEERRLFVKLAFVDWVAVCIILIANCPITIACNFTKAKSSVTKVRDINKGLNTVLACVYLVGIPLSFLAWYWPIYQSNHKMRPTQHVLALSGLIIALAQAIFAFVGPESYGFCGVLATKWIGKTRPAGVVVPMAIVTALWGLQAIFTCYMVCQVFIYYRRDLAARRAQRRQQTAAAA
jgi:RsiW-degrading membrane proteinase PrsW (M82 family)